MRRKTPLRLSLQVLALGAVAFLAANGIGYAQGSAVDQVKAAIEAYHAAIESLDVAKMAPLWAHQDDIWLVNPRDKTIAVGWPAVEKDWQATFAPEAEVKIAQTAGPQVQVAGQVAWAAGIVGAVIKMKSRTTIKAFNFQIDAFEKHDGKWLLVSHVALRLPESIPSQTGGESVGQMTDQQFKALLRSGDAEVVKDINRHDAYVVAWHYSQDATDIAPSGIAVGRPAIERRLSEDFNKDGTDFSETIDQAHLLSKNSGWFIGHWSGTRLVGEQRLRVDGYVAALVERRNDFWKARLHVIGRLPTLSGPEPLRSHL